MSTESSTRTISHELVSHSRRWVFHFICVTSQCIALINSSPAAAAQDKSKERAAMIDTYELMMSALNLSDVQAKKLEDKLIDDGADLATRITLLGYYRFSKTGGLEADRRFVQHALWMIENEPEHSVTGREAEIDAILNAGAFKKGKEIWQEHITENPKNTKILGNAASFLLLHEREVAKTYLLRARELEPTNPEWPKRLGRLYMLSDQAQEECAKALTNYENALAGMDSRARYSVLESVAKAAFCASELEKARKYGQELLDSAVEQHAGQNYGNAVHHGNLILGRVALKQGEIEGAERFLIRAGKTSGSPQLNSFGPNMQLALDLLEAGRSAVVLEYLEACKKFWKYPKLNAWITDVKEG